MDKLGRMVLDLHPDMTRKFVERKKQERLDAAQKRDLEHMEGTDWWQRAFEGEDMSLGKGEEWCGLAYVMT